MSETTVGGSVISGAAPTKQFSGAVIRNGTAIIVLISLLVGIYVLQSAVGYGAASSFSLLVGAALGFLFQRGRFCFFCITRDYVQYKDSTGLYSILAALAVGAIGYTIVFGAFLPNAFAGRLPPNAHIGPVSWVLLPAGLAFGIGMALSGACISGHLYRLGEGYTRAPFALVGSMIGFGVGFFTWNTLYLNAIADAPKSWLPATFGYGGSLALTLAILGGLALFFLRRLPESKPSEGGKWTLKRVHHLLFGQRWNPIVTGALVGLVGVFAYFRVEPLGVTSQLGSISRTFLENGGYLPDRINGLDTLAGCAMIVIQGIMDNGWLIIGVVFGSFASALLANKFKPGGLTLTNGFTALLGGILMGWGAMTAIGCTVGTLLSGISAFAVSGWVFAFAVFIGIWLGVKLRLMS